MIRATLSGVCIVATVGLGARAGAEDWTRFRGPNGSGVAEAHGLPTRFGPEENLAWATPVPFGRSSPVVGGGLVFVTAVEDAGFTTLAVDRPTGAERWRRTLPRDRHAEMHTATDSSTPSAATDGANVYVFFPETGLVSYTAAGEERWRHPLGPFRNFYGIASSPILAGDALLLVCDQALGSFLLALDKDTGETLWRQERFGRLESFTTPVLHPVAEPELVIVAGSKAVDAYRIDDGERVWTLEGVGAAPVASPVLAGRYLYLTAPDQMPEPPPPFSSLLAEHDADGDGVLSRSEVADTWMVNHFGWIDVDGDGAFSQSDSDSINGGMQAEGWGLFGIRLPEPGGTPEILWNHRQNIAYIPTPVVVDGVVFMVDDSILTSLDGATGHVHKRGRLGQGFKVFSSPVAGDGKVYVASREGAVAVIDARADWSVLAVNELGEEVQSTPAIADRHVIVRTRDRLMSFALPSGESAEADES